MAERAFKGEDYEAAREYIDIVIRNGEPVSQLDDAELMMAQIHEWVGYRDAAMDAYRRIA